MTDSLTKRDQLDRSKINMNQAHEVHYWTKHTEGDCEGRQLPTQTVRKELAM
jgi:hypothetical protein